MTESSSHEDLRTDLLLRDIPESEGFKLLDRCLLFARIGQGGMGAVYRARHLNLDIDVAVKCLKPELGQQNQEFVQRFQREARVAAAINNEHLVRVFDVAETSGLHYLIMEYIPGETARERLGRKGSLGLDEALTIALGATKGLAVAHKKGLVHRDVKPDNIMIAQDGSVKLADLGLVRATDGLDNLQTATGMVMGTPRYMPPEQFEDARGVGPAGDVWAMGAVLFFLLTGKDGIERGSLPEVMRRVMLDGFPALSSERPDLPAELGAIIRRCTAPRPEDRYADASELGRALESFLATVGGESALADPSAGAGSRHHMVSPPPAATIATVRGGLEQTPTRLVGSESRGSEARTEISVGSKTKTKTKPTSGKKGPVVLTLGLLGLAAVVVLAYLFLFDQKKEEPDELRAVSEGAASAPVTAEPPREGELPATRNAEPSRETDEVGRGDEAAARRELEPTAEMSDEDRPGVEEPTSIPKDELATEPKDTAFEAEELDVEPKAVQEPVIVPSWRDWARALPGTRMDETLGLPLEVIHAKSGIPMVLVLAGEYQRGAGPDDGQAWRDENPRHLVRITKPFYLGKFEVTNGQYRLFRPEHDSGSSRQGSLNGDDQPVVNVSWREAQDFGRNFELRLPTEAEWEYACRAGTTTPYYGDLAAIGWTGLSKVSVTQPGGRKAANAWGLFDMIGNVEEWCSDFYAADSYAGFGGRTAIDPQGPPRGQLRIMRGGSLKSGDRDCRVSMRNRNAETGRYPQTGFRVLRNP